MNEYDYTEEAESVKSIHQYQPAPGRRAVVIQTMNDILKTHGGEDKTDPEQYNSFDLKIRL